jgi:hypothetical protein
MNSCFENLVGIRGGCNSDVAPFLLDNIGISLKMLGYAKDERFLNHTDYFNKMHEMAWTTVLNDVNLNGIGFDNGKVLHDTTNGTFNGSYTAIIEPILIEITDRCKYATLMINKVSLYISAEIGGTISFNEEVVYTATAKLTQQKVEILVNDTYDSLEITFSGVTSLGLVNNSNNIYANVGDNAIFSYFVMCDNQKILCKFAKIIAPAVLIKLAAIIYHDIYISGRWNEFIELKRETAVAEMARLDSTYNYLAYDVNNSEKDGEYQRILKTIKITSSATPCPCCQSCKGKTSYVYAIP